MIFLKVREVRSRYVGYPATFEGFLTERVEAGIWKTRGRSRGHSSREEAQGAILTLADRRGIKLENDPRHGKDPGRELRRVEFADRYGVVGDEPNPNDAESARRGVRGAVMRRTTPIDADIAVMSRQELLRELHRLEPQAGWNTAATGARTLRLCLQERRETCAACFEIGVAGLSYQEHACGKKAEAAPSAADDALTGGRP